MFEGWREEWADVQAQVRQTLTGAEFDAAAATTLNAHYTDPAVVRAVWDALEEAGLSQGTVLEPGCGAGTFIGMAPAGVRMVGVELDPLTAQIASHLYPGAHIVASGFQNAPLGRADLQPFDAAVGNVPFGGFSLHDPIDNPLRLSIHNHFIAKALRRTKPGGYVALLTSSFTMDAQRSTSRAYTARFGRLLGAVRLPSGAFSRVAGTDVVTDLLILRRHTSDDAATIAQDHWLGTRPVEVDGQVSDKAMNVYFHDNPHHVLGDLGLGHGIHGSQTLIVKGPTGPELAERVRAAALDIVNQARESFPYDPTPAPVPAWFAPGLHTPPPPELAPREGQVREGAKGFEAWSGHREAWEPVKVARSRVGEVRQLLRLRDAAREVVASQTSGASEADKDAARTALGRAYDHYVATFGPINRFTLTAGRAPSDKQIETAVARLERKWMLAAPEGVARTAEDVPDELRADWLAEASEPSEGARRQEHLAPLRCDPDFALVCALEDFDEANQTATKAAIFHRDVVHPPVRSVRAETPAEALAITLDETGGVDVERIAELLGIDAEDVPGALAGLVFTDPDGGHLVPAETYLSGDVRAKLARARRAQGDDGAFVANVAALEAVVPPTVPLSDVTMRPGAGWLGTKLHAQFVREVFEMRVEVTKSPADGSWMLDGPARSATPAHVLFQYGTEDRAPLDLLDSMMNNKPVTIWRTEKLADGKERRWQDMPATAAAREKVRVIEGAFTTWVHADPDRVATLETRYNELFNSYRAPDHTAAGARLSLPGLNPQITPHPYQRAAVAQALTSHTVLLDHVVGAGKTGTMVMTAMELRRLGLARKPWLVVPNHLVEQMAREWRTWYPDSKVLAIPTGQNPAQRREWVARSAAGDWDGVICPASTFKAIGVAPARQAEWLAEDIAALREDLEASEVPNKRREKHIQAAIKRLEAEYERVLGNKDTGLTFEQSGCDYLLVDEAHHYKNLARTSAVPDLDHTGSQQARDLGFKLRALREAKTEAGAGELTATATFATGTPVANSLAEMWVMQTYLRPDLLAAASVEKIDSWARQFALTESKLELAPDAVTWRPKERVVGFVNVPELMALSNQFTSVVTREHLTAAVPDLDGGGRQVIERDPSPEVAAYVLDLAHRAAHLPADKTQDNLLKITSDGRLVAIDPRLRGLPADVDGGRLGDVADTVMKVHRDTADRVFTDPEGNPHPTKGGLQLVFCDTSTPSEGWNVYDALRDELVARGMDAGAVRFIHDATDDAERAVLFEACRDGRVSVLIGSTAKMGTGTNVQLRATALHHVDCPWRPADLEQREGRLVRQGNQNPTVSIFTYITKRTYDAVVWQYIFRKASFIAQVKVGQATGRTISDLGDDMVISAAAAQAIATGDPRVMRRAELIEKVTSLENLHTSWTNERAAIRRRAREAEQTIAARQSVLPALEAAAARAVPTEGEGFVYTAPDGRTTRTRTEAATWLFALIRSYRSRGSATGASTEPMPLGTLGGHPWHLAPGLSVMVAVDDAPTVRVETPVKAGTQDPLADLDPLGLVRRLEYAAAHIPEAIARNLELIASAESTRDAAHAALENSVFSGAEELATARADLAAIDAELQLADDEPAAAAAPVEGPRRVYAAELTEAGIHTEVRVADLKVGDAFFSKDAKTTIMEVTAQADDDRAAQAVPAGAGVDAEARTYHRYAVVELVSRRWDALEDVHRLILDRDPTDAITQGPWGIKPGERITVQTRVPASPGTPAPDYARGLVATTGTLLKTENGLWHVQTDDGGTVELCPPHHGAVGLRHGVLDLNAAPAESALTVGHLLPGDQAHGIEHPVLPETIVAAVDASSHGRVYLCPQTGDTFHPDRSTPIASLTPGRDLNPIELEAICGSAAPDLRVSDLRPGDLVPLCDIDAKNKATTPVRLLTTGGYGSFHDLTYRPDDEPTDEPSSTRRKADAPVNLLARRYGALTEAETRTLIHPGTVSSRTNPTALKDAEPGTPVWFSTFREANYGPTHDHIGTVLTVTEELYPKITAHLEDGTRLHATLAGRAVVYPAGATIPEHVDRTGHGEQPAPPLPGAPLAPGLEVTAVQPRSRVAGP